MRSNKMLLPLVLLLFSGFTGLVYEFCWGKRLGIVLGNSGEAHSIVLATFMGGLALGAALFGRMADRSKRPLMLYGFLELCVGLYALAFPRLLEALHQFYVQFAPEGAGWSKTALRLLCASAALLPPTVLMGGTLPAMTKSVTRQLSDVRQKLSLLYATNSLGAALGCLMSGVVMVPERGILVTERTAAGLNVLLALAALALGFLSPSEESVTMSAEPSAGPKPRKSLVRAALVVTLLTGFTSMVYELTWIRVLASILGGTAYAFTLILTAFIVGISLGSFWLSRRTVADERLLKTLMWLQAGLVATVCLTVPWYERLPYWFVRVNFLLSHSIEAWSTYQTITFFLAALVVVPPAFFLGASFPAAARLSMSSVQQAGQGLGRAYLFNTAGTVSGSLLGGLVLMPAIGLEGNLVVGVVCNLLGLAVCLQALAKEGPQGRLGWLLPVVALSAAALLVTNRGWSTKVANSPRARDFQSVPESISSFRALRDQSRVTFHGDDVFASVTTAVRDRVKALRINGKIDASNSTDMYTQILVGMLGPSLQPVKRVLIIGLGSGVTAGAVLAFPDVEVDVVEISAAVVKAADQFSTENGDALRNPRCHVYAEDARTFLESSREKYDLIISEPSNPWVAGVSELFSHEFYQMAQSKLARGGLLVQWIHAYESNDELVKMVFRTARRTFQYGTTWLGLVDLVLVLGEAPLQPDFDFMRRQLDIASVAKSFARIPIVGVHALLAQQMQDDVEQAEFAGTGVTITDDQNRLEYASPVGYFLGQNVRVPDGRLGQSAQSSRLWRNFVRASPVDRDSAKAIYQSFVSEFGASQALFRTTAEQWLAHEPNVLEPALAVAKACSAQRDFVCVERVLGPHLHHPDLSAELAQLYLSACFSSKTRQNTQFAIDDRSCESVRLKWWTTATAPALVEVLIDSQRNFPDRR